MVVLKLIFLWKKMRVQLCLSKPKPTPHNSHMVDQTITKTLGLIKDLRIIGHGIPNAMTFTIIKNNVFDSNYSMLLGRPWLKDVKVSHVGATTLLLYKELIWLEPYLLLRNLEHEPSVQKY